MTTQTSRRKFIQAGMLSSFGALAGMASEASAAEKTENSAQNASNTFDVIVLGCGIAGLVAALQAKAEGASVALFEKICLPFTMFLIIMLSPLFFLQHHYHVWRNA